MIYRALLPVKALDQAKSRLAAHLSQRQRENLVLDMLKHVLSVLRASSAVEQISVVTPDYRVMKLAEEWGAQALLEEAQGHNAALHAAALQLQQAGTPALLTIAADLPLLHVNDIHGLIAQSTHYPIILAPSREGTGTNAILMRPPLALPYLFGVGSFQRYQQAAQLMHLRSTSYASIGLGLDIDTIDDLDDLYELQILTGEHKPGWQHIMCGSLA